MKNLVQKLKKTHSKSEVIKLAQKKNKSLKAIDGSPRRRLLAFVESMNGDVKYLTSDCLCETVKVNKDETFTIYLPTDSSEERDNFTIAHELGHILLHRRERPKGQEVRFTRRGSNRMEWEANWFAAEFLMPREEVERAFQKDGLSLSQLAAKFGVSQMAARVRLESLELIEP
ncbi:ImmA/IrrE family metallo-endopeptidase [Halodesulfovibrio sp.]|uniref:ImmA/IrrE family metallo-endopeptidase n=1 Tax=Halodesulfovibrio sp. TaxID=1912772 RepID=UPI0025DC5C11|nr:ImmA/IrrE family metallo-endopeptidase [Halodesulfovibrio sp.]MCT4534449.1 ImmA/IrrE family metallo-endopeptidase [Halodesulfovibrio sp.]